MKKIILLLFINITLLAETIQPSNTTLLTAIAPTEQAHIETNTAISKIQETEPESTFQKASLPMKVAIIVGIPIVAVGAVVYYAVLTPFALIRWAIESKN